LIGHAYLPADVNFPEIALVTGIPIAMDCSRACAFGTRRVTRLTAVIFQVEIFGAFHYTGFTFMLDSLHSPLVMGYGVALDTGTWPWAVAQFASLMTWVTGPLFQIKGFICWAHAGFMGKIRWVHRSNFWDMGNVHNWSFEPENIFALVKLVCPFAIDPDIFCIFPKRADQKFVPHHFLVEHDNFSFENHSSCIEGSSQHKFLGKCCITYHFFIAP
jgi:hypothetical protein